MNVGKPVIVVLGRISQMQHVSGFRKFIAGGNCERFKQ